MRLALKQAQSSKFNRARVGAVIVKGGRVLGSGSNRIGFTKYIHRSYPESVHAEQQALLSSIRQRKLHDLEGATIFVSRINRCGMPKYSRPCPDCHTLLTNAGLKKVVYTTNEGLDEYYL